MMMAPRPGTCASQATGMSFKQWLLEQRLAHARSLPQAVQNIAAGVRRFCCMCAWALSARLT
jgi:hypothetical protein